MTVEEAKRTGGQAVDKLKQKGGQAVERVEETTQEAAGRAQGKLRQQVDQRSQELAGQVESTAEAIRKASDELREQGKEQPADLMTRGADKVEQLGRYLKDTSAEQMLHDAEDAARKKPWATLAGGAAAGFALSRLLRASSGKRQTSSSEQRDGQAQAEGERQDASHVVVAEPAPQPVRRASRSRGPRTTTSAAGRATTRKG